MRLTVLIVCSVLFVVTHMLLSHRPIRGPLVKLMGEWLFRGFYSLISFVTLGGAVVAIWGHLHLGPLLWELPRWLVLGLNLPLMLLALLLIVLAVRSPSPAGIIPGRMEPRGVLHITRHPMNLGLACFGAAHMLANGHLGDVVFFGSFVVLGTLGVVHQDRRKAVNLGEPYVAFMGRTSVLPFVALVRGRTRLPLGELNVLLLLVAIAACVALALFHGQLFGIIVF